MKRSHIYLLITVLLTAPFAGCFGGDEEVTPKPIAPAEVEKDPPVEAYLTTQTTPPIAMCDAGGRILESGIDNGEGGGVAANGILENGEVDTKTTLCSRYTTGMLKDIKSGTGASSPGEFTEFGGRVFFTADSQHNGTELWATDGTHEGTTLIKDIRPGNQDSSPQHLTQVGSYLFFTADNGTHGRELWVSDGTEAGTRMVTDLVPGSGDPSITEITAVGNIAYFAASNDTLGTELWKSNGTETGTVLVKDIRNGTQASNPTDLTSVGNVLYFEANDGINGRALWRDNGAINGTILVKDIPLIPDMVQDCLTNTASNQPHLLFLFVTVPLLAHLTNVNGTLFFSAKAADTGQELWKTDGTELGTTIVRDVYYGTHGSNPDSFTNIGNILYFVATNGNTYGKELWRSDGTEIGTYVIKDIVYGGTGSSPTELQVLGDLLLFSADDGSTASDHGRELWITNGSKEGTVMIADIAQGPTDSTPTQLTVVRGHVYFIANDGSHGAELWRSDGTANGTHLFKDLKSGPSNAGISNLATASGTLFFSANVDYGQEIWANSFIETSPIFD